MSSLSITQGVYCGGEALVPAIMEATGFTLLRDEDVIEAAARKFSTESDRLRRAMYNKPSVFDKFTHEKDRCVAFLRSAMADMVERDNTLYLGLAGHLVPKTISHILKVCLISDTRSRLQRGADTAGGEPEAKRRLLESDYSATLWTEYLFQKEPWDSSLYDLILPTDKISAPEIPSVIKGYLERDIVKATPKSMNAIADFKLLADVSVALAGAGHKVLVAVEDGIVLLSIDKHVIMLSRLEEELKQIVSAVPGVREVKTRIGPNFYQADIYRRTDFEAPSKVLLVDDEREFVQTLSERMMMRDLGTHVLYTGEDALSFIEDETPEVIVLDLKMPGIDGIEVLRRIKKAHPEIEVIILTGHGSGKDEEKCKELGAFAYLEKPVNIELLTRTVNMAYGKVRYSNR